MKEVFQTSDWRTKVLINSIQSGTLVRQSIYAKWFLKEMLSFEEVNNLLFIHFHLMKRTFESFLYRICRE